MINRSIDDWRRAKCWAKWRIRIALYFLSPSFNYVTSPIYKYKTVSVTVYIAVQMSNLCQIRSIKRISFPLKNIFAKHSIFSHKNRKLIFCPCALFASLLLLLSTWVTVSDQRLFPRPLLFTSRIKGECIISNLSAALVTWVTRHHTIAMH